MLAQPVIIYYIQAPPRGIHTVKMLQEDSRATDGITSPALKFVICELRVKLSWKGYIVESD